LNIMMSGIQWWTTDIGGYFNGNITSPEWRELIVRWFQWGAFCPIFRLHGCRVPQLTPDQCGFTCGNNEVWMFGDTAYEIIKSVMLLREQFRPYIMTQMQLASSKGTPIMRPLWFDFPKDPGCQQIDDQFMFGPDYMVAPVLEYQARSRQVYFPSGGNWVDYFTQTTYNGGSTVNVAAPLERFPLYKRL